MSYAWKIQHRPDAVKFENKVVIITGASRGLGRFLVEQYLQEGARVFGCARSEGNALRHERYQFIQLDVTDEKAVAAWIHRIAKEAGRIDILINNAGIASMNHSLLMPARTAQNLLMVNVLGTFLVSRECAKIMQRVRYGRIVNFSSVAVPLRLEGEALYAAAKAANEAFTRVFAREIAALGITCNAIGPGPIRTDLIRNVPEDRLNSLVQRLPFKRLGTTDDLWPTISFLTSPEADNVTGQVIYLGGAG